VQATRENGAGRPKTLVPHGSNKSRSVANSGEGHRPKPLTVVHLAWGAARPAQPLHKIHQLDLVLDANRDRHLDGRWANYRKCVLLDRLNRNATSSICCSYFLIAHVYAPTSFSAIIHCGYMEAAHAEDLGRVSLT
jgi:hypothetical protein